MSTRNRRIIREDNGCLVLLADTPNSGAVVVAKTGQRTGNKRHDGRSGKFAPASGKKKTDASQSTSAGANIDEAELERMLSAARDAAREFDSFDEGDIKEFLKGRAKDHTVVDLEQFIALARRQRVSDLADLLDQQLRASGSMKQGRRKVRLTSPKGFLRKALNDITQDEANTILGSLLSRGHSEKESKSFLNAKLSKGSKITLSDAQFSDVEDDQPPSEMMQFVEVIRSQPTAAEIAASIVAAVTAAPPPQIVVNIPEQKPRTLSIKRGPNGLMEAVEES